MDKVFQIKEDGVIIAWAATMHNAHIIAHAFRTDNYRMARTMAQDFKEYTIIESPGFYA